MKNQITILAFLLITICGYSQSEVVYYQNFENWSNGVPTNWGGPGTNIELTNIVPNQYQLGPTNTSAKFFGNSTGVTKITTPYFTMDSNYCYYIYYRFRTNSVSLEFGYDTIMNNRSQFSDLDNQIEFSQDSTLWYEGIIRYRPKMSNSNSELIFTVLPGTWIELDDVSIFKSTFQDTLYICNIGALINSNGNFFNQLNENLSSGFFFPKNSIKNTFKCINFWIGGYDVENQLHLAGQLYPNSSTNQNFTSKDFSFGPVSNDTTMMYNLLYDHVWKINKSEIDYHIVHYNDPNYIVPLSISQWPAHGRIDQGEMSILAPFVDVDNNNMYNPENGDYPKIRGDQAVYFMLNDQRLLHGSGGQKLGVQINGMAYGYDIPTDTNLYNTIFFNLDIHNRSTYNYHDIYFGTFADFDIGYPFDDYIGCDSTRNMCFSYNGDTFDGTVNNSEHYGENPPIQGIVSLNNPMSAFIYFNKDLSPRGLPENDSHYFYYLTARFKDGTHCQYNGNGWQTGYLDCSFMFCGNPMDLSSNSWTEINVANVPQDRRGIMSSGPFTLNAGQNMYYDLAFPVIRTTNNENYNISGLQSMVDSIQSYYNSMNYYLDTTNTQVDDYQNSIDCKVYPNPNSGQFRMVFSELPINGRIEFYNTLGQLIQEEMIQNSSETFDLKPHSGMIFYTVFSENKMVFRGKIVVK